MAFGMSIEEQLKNFITNEHSLDLMLQDSGLHKVCKDIRSLARTNKKLNRSINDPGTTETLITTLTQKLYNQTNGDDRAKVAEILATRGALDWLLQSSKYLSIPKEIEPLDSGFTYFTLLPLDVYKLIIEFTQRKTSLNRAKLILRDQHTAIENKPVTIPEIVQWLQKEIDKGNFEDNFKTIHYLAAHLPSYQEDRQATLLVAARLLDTPNAKNWWKNTNPDFNTFDNSDCLMAQIYLFDYKNSLQALIYLEKLTKHNKYNEKALLLLFRIYNEGLNGMPKDTTMAERYAHRLLFCAIRNFNLNTVNELLSNGISSTIKNELAIPALHCAVEVGSSGIVEALLKHGAGANNTEKSTALLLAAAAEADNPTITRKLLEAGADYTIRNYRGKTALEIAREHNNFNIAACIKKHIRAQNDQKIDLENTNKKQRVERPASNDELP